MKVAMVLRVIVFRMGRERDFALSKALLYRFTRQDKTRQNGTSHVLFMFKEKLGDVAVTVTP